jgi:hypothetical protein
MIQFQVRCNHCGCQSEIASQTALLRLPAADLEGAEAEMLHVCPDCSFTIRATVDWRVASQLPIGRWHHRPCPSQPAPATSRPCGQRRSRPTTTGPRRPARATRAAHRPHLAVPVPRTDLKVGWSAAGPVHTGSDPWITFVSSAPHRQHWKRFEDEPPHNSRRSRRSPRRHFRRKSRRTPRDQRPASDTGRG